MTLNTYGVSPTIDEQQWAILHQIYLNERVSAVGDFNVTAAAGNRIVSVAGGSLVTAGVLVTSSAPTSVTLDVQTGGGLSRIDYIVAEIDWTGTQTTATTIKFVKGTAAATPVAPNLTRVAGTLWQVALARITLTAGISQLAAANIDVCVPTQRKFYTYDAAVDTKTLSGSGETTIARLNGTDPGWPYILRIEGRTGFTSVSVGQGIILGYVDGNQVTSGLAGGQNVSDPTLRPVYTAPRTGAWAATMTMARGNTMTDPLTTQPSRGGFTVTVIPS